MLDAGNYWSHSAGLNILYENDKPHWPAQQPTSCNNNVMPEVTTNHLQIQHCLIGPFQIHHHWQSHRGCVFITKYQHGFYQGCKTNKVFIKHEHLFIIERPTMTYTSTPHIHILSVLYIFCLPPIPQLPIYIYYLSYASSVCHLSHNSPYPYIICPMSLPSATYPPTPHIHI